MKIEEGKCYRRRDGVVIGPMESNGSNRRFPLKCDHMSYQLDGKYGDEEHCFDLVEEVQIVPVLPFDLDLRAHSWRHRRTESGDGMTYTIFLLSLLGGMCIAVTWLDVLRFFLWTLGLWTVERTESE